MLETGWTFREISELDGYQLSALLLALAKKKKEEIKLLGRLFGAKV